MERLGPRSFQVAVDDGRPVGAVSGQDNGGQDNGSALVPYEEHVGVVLREARQLVGTDLNDVATSLRIRYVYLSAIEAGRFDDLPGATYAIGFVRTYADYLGLDSDRLVERFKSEVGGIGPQQQLEFPTPMPDGRFPGGAILTVSILLAVAAVGGWTYLQGRDAVVVERVSEPPQTTDAGGRVGVPAAATALRRSVAPATATAPVEIAVAPQTPRPVVPTRPATAAESSAPEPVSESVLSPAPASPAPRPVATAVADTAAAAEPLVPLRDEVPAVGTPEAVAALAPPTPVVARPVVTRPVVTGPAAAPRVDVPPQFGAARLDGPSSPDVVAATGIIEPRREANVPPVLAPSRSAAPVDETSSQLAALPPQPPAARLPAARSTAAQPTTAQPLQLTRPAPAGPVALGPSARASSASTIGAPVALSSGAARPTVGTNIPSPATAIASETQVPRPGAGAVRSAALPEPPPTQLATLPDVPAADVGAAGGVRVYGQSNRNARIVLTAMSDSWVQVRDDSQNVLLTRMLRAGDSYRVPNRRGLFLLTGNAGALEIAVDGEIVPPIGPVGAVRRDMRLDAELLKRGPNGG